MSRIELEKRKQELEKHQADMQAQQNALTQQMSALVQNQLRVEGALGVVRELIEKSAAEELPEKKDAPVTTL